MIMLQVWDFIINYLQDKSNIKSYFIKKIYLTDFAYGCDPFFVKCVCVTFSIYLCCESATVKKAKIFGETPFLWPG